MCQTLYYNGKIITVNDAQPTVEAVLVEDGKIKAVGTLADLENLISDNTKKVDLAGKAMLPGFIDGHSHISFSRLFPRFDAPPVGNIDSPEKLVEECRAYLAENPLDEGNWLVGMGYDNIAFPEHKHPTRYDLDKISTDIPVVMMHASGHIGCVNSKVFEILNITKDTPNPDGGIIQRDPVTGEPTGMVEENALIQTVLGQMPLPTAEFTMAGVKRSQELYLSHGVTTAQDGSFDEQNLPLLEHMSKMGLLKMDVYVYPQITTPSKHLMDGKTSRDAVYRNHVKVAGMKFFLDGSPQAKTAWLTEPYYVVPEGEAEDYRAYPVHEDDNEVCDYFKECLKNKWQILVHCNGDAAIDQFINQYARAQKETGIYDELRPVVIHCQTVREDQLDRMKEIGMMPSFFHDHVYYWGDWHLDSVLGPVRGARISPLASAQKCGIKFTLHQDTPVAPPDMILSIHNAVNRKTRSGRDIGPEFAIDVMEAIRAVTIYGAVQCFEEDSKGSIEVGKLADFVVLDKSPLDVEKEHLREIKVLQTIKEDTVIYSAE